MHAQRSFSDGRFLSLREQINLNSILFHIIRPEVKIRVYDISAFPFLPEALLLLPHVSSENYTLFNEFSMVNGIPLECLEYVSFFSWFISLLVVNEAIKLLCISVHQLNGAEIPVDPKEGRSPPNCGWKLMFNRENRPQWSLSLMLLEFYGNCEQYFSCFRKYRKLIAIFISCLLYS